MFLLNKWDLKKKDTGVQRQMVETLRYEAPFLGYAPVLTVSAKTGLRIPRIFNTINQIYEQYNRRIGTGHLNRILEGAVRRNEPSLYRGRRIKFFYGAQMAAKPPTMVFFVNYPQAVHFSYQRYLVNRLREEAGLDLTPIRLVFRKRERRELSFKKKTGKRKGTARRK